MIDKINSSVSVKILPSVNTSLSFNLEQGDDICVLRPIIEKYYRDNNRKKIIITLGQNNEVYVDADLSTRNSLIITGLDYDQAVALISKAIDNVDRQEFINKVKKFKWQRG